MSSKRLEPATMMGMPMRSLACRPRVGGSILSPHAVDGQEGVGSGGGKSLGRTVACVGGCGAEEGSTGRERRGVFLLFF